MAKAFIASIAIVVGLSCLRLLPALAASLVLATDDTPGNPWIMGGGSHFQKKSPGLEIELYRLMAEKLNLQLKVVRLPWKRCLSELEHGRVDGVFPASFKPERLSLGRFPTKNGRIDPTRKSRDSAYFLYTRRASPLGWDGRSFVNMGLMDRKTIGVPLDWSIVTDLRQMGVDLLEKPRPVDLLIILRKGGIAGVVCLDTVIDAYIVQSPSRYQDIQKIFPPVAEKAYYLMLSHAFVSQQPDLSEKIWDTIAKIKKSDEYKTLLMRYTR
ncbi:transporter substrate-binding domain-containing protein [uncultured Desulfosarcina sp.]|uniref:substrate-binding periplasmic protein n=1 Tax=uncultured Desulfosarcina sp. TaxID=218289 RepID=UPI0029C8BA33|nr:transporter substrate-binding domain-containing protein [uncultured Desulfosarcina sp.]